MGPPRPPVATVPVRGWGGGPAATCQEPSRRNETPGPPPQPPSGRQQCGAPPRGETERADPSERRPDHPGVGSAQPSLCVRHGLCGDVRPPQTSPGSLGLGAVPVGGQDRDEGRPAPCSAVSSPRGHHPPGVRRSWRSRGDKQK